MMKKIPFLFLFVVLFVNSQEIEKLDINDYVVKANFLENKYDDKYLLIGDFLPVKDDSNIKLAKIFTNTGWGYIDEKGNEIVRPTYKKISNFKNGIALADYLANSKTKGQFYEETGFVNYQGHLMNSYEYSRYKWSDENYFTKDFFYATENYRTGILTPEGQILIPFKYQNISYTDKYFIADYLNPSVYQSKSVDIYSKKGKLLKTIKICNDIGEANGQLFQIDINSNYFFINKDFERIDNRNFYSINKVENSKLFKIEVSYLKPNDVYESYYIDKNLQIISPSFPNATVYKDRFLIQPVSRKDEDLPYKFVIADFKNNKLAEYSYNDFMIYEYFAHGKLDDPKYLSSQKDFWSGLTRDFYYPAENWEYYKSQFRSQFIRVYDNNGYEKPSFEGIIDAETGKIVVKRNKSETSGISYIEKNQYYIVKLKGENTGKIDILDSKGNFLKKVEGLEITEISKEFLMVKTKTEKLGYNTINKYNLLDPKTLKPIFSEDMRGLSDSNFVQEQNYLLFYPGSGKLGIIDNKYKIIRPGEYIDGEVNSNINAMILKKDHNSVEILDKKTLKTIIDIEFKDGILKEKHQLNSVYFNKTGFYKNGFYIINDDKNIMDRYGNIIKKPVDFDFYHN